MTPIYQFFITTILKKVVAVTIGYGSLSYLKHLLIAHCQKKFARRCSAKNFIEFTKTWDEVLFQ